MNKECEEKLSTMRAQMEKASAFAEKHPMFAKQILESLITGEEDWVTVAQYYKTVRTYNGVSRGHFASGSRRYVINYSKEHDAYLWTVYINTLTEYDSYRKYGLNEIHQKVPVFFYDNLNSTFYCTDEQIYGLLEALSAWKIEAMKHVSIDDAEKDVRVAEYNLLKANEKLASLKEKQNE